MVYLPSFPFGFLCKLPQKINMALGWNEVKERAVRFSKEWKDAFNEKADAKQFLIEFFNVFGISNRRVATSNSARPTKA
jgi:hypothetical protein